MRPPCWSSPATRPTRRRRLIALADDPPERARLAVASLRQAAGWPDEDDVVEDLLAGYAAVRTRR